MTFGPKEDPTPQQSMAELFASTLPLMELMVQHAGQMARTRRALYEAYLAEGFTETQALELCKNVTFS